MQIVDYHDKLLPSLTRLINQQIAGLPPCCVMTQEQVADTIARGGSLWNIHYPASVSRTPAGRFACWSIGWSWRRRQWYVPRLEHGIFVVQWIVANPERPQPLRTLLHLLDKAFEASGLRQNLHRAFFVRRRLVRHPRYLDAHHRSDARNRLPAKARPGC